ncbi:aminopeptidase N [Chromatiaceae bacterium AAb-1]|nr:aminopeptidase N [Chromatiaceae bacterium AAb-1]
MSVAGTERTVKRLSDYCSPDFSIEKLHLTFELDPEATKVTAQMTVQRQRSEKALMLDGQQLKLLSVSIDGYLLLSEQYQQTEDMLIINDVPAQFELQLVTEINPAANTMLEGLYLASGAFCTQCEAEGFRRITYYPDRPDVLAVYTTTIIADKTRYPYLLSNGNKISEKQLDNGFTEVTWHDPFPKPCYLFALVAGDFDLLTDEFITASGRAVKLELYVDKGNLPRAGFAMDSLKRAMRWDEQRFNLEYDLDIYMVVAVDFFNMGAMENKGLNVFNSKYVLADEKTATDKDYFNIESIIGHEYFHNWTGNRVTCRDWFQLSLKEGLTVFRDQEFSADMSSATLNRIDAVKVIRTAQFAEDAGPMAHPIRPEQVLEMNNFYTVTVYDKGAEVIRMLQTILGRNGFNRGISLYLKRHDGQAVTCDDFVKAMEDANQTDLSQFRLWYSQSGTPELTVSKQYHAATEELILTLRQYTPPTSDQTEKKPLLIPVKIQLLSEDKQVNQRELLLLNQAEQQFVFQGVKASPVLVLLEDFSAPVKLLHQYCEQDLLLIAAQAENGFARWDAMQQLWSQQVRASIDTGSQPILSDSLTALLRNWLNNPLADLALTAELLRLPDFDTLAEQYQQIPVEGILQCLSGYRQLLATTLAKEFADCYQRLLPEPYRYDEAATARRLLRNTCLYYLAALPAGEALLTQQYQQADNMTDTIAVLTACQQVNPGLFGQFTADFASAWQHDTLVMDKCFSLVATEPSEQVFERIAAMETNPLFSWKNPNRVRALYGAFSTRNPQQFHRKDGRGYQLLADVVLKMDKLNPQVAARLITPLLSWKRFTAEHQIMMKQVLQQIAETPKLSNDVYEKVNRSLK